MIDNVIPRSLIELMHGQTKECVKKHPHLKTHPNLCEVAFISTLSGKGSYTLHTHPDNEVPYPSGEDKRTTHLLKKDNLCIIMPTGKTLCWHKSDNFEKLKEEF